MAKDSEKSGAKGGDPSGMSNLGFAINLPTTVPIVHILAACFFLFGYCQGFRHHIISFVTISDVFAVSMRALGQVYLLMLLTIAVFFVDRVFRRKKPGSKPFAAAFFLVIVILLFIAMPIPFTSSRNQNDGEIWSWVALASIAAGFLFWLGRSDSGSAQGLDFSPRTMAIGLIVLLAFAVTLGVNKGTIDRGRHYDESALDYSTCGRAKNVVIRPIGPYFLALNRANRWLLVDDKCEGRFELNSEH